MTGCDNKRALDDAAAIQKETLAALDRIQMQATETESVGITTLAELQEHREKMDRILKEGDRLHDQLDTTKKLQNKFQRWNLSFGNLRKANREAAGVKASLRKKDDIKRERQIRLSATVEESESSSAGSRTPPQSSSLVVKRSKRRDKKKKKKKQAPEQAPTQRGLLDGIETTDNPYRDELHNLADADAVIDTKLDGIDSQLDTLLGLSKNIHAETKRQNAAVDEITNQIESASDKQAVANSRARRFLTGRKRNEYEKKRTLFGAL